MLNIKSKNNGIDLPFVRSFSGHETFPFRSSWLKKGVDWVNKDPSIFQREDAVVKFGVGKNMVQSIRHWCIATRVVEDLAKSKSGVRVAEPTINTGQALVGYKDGKCFITAR